MVSREWGVFVALTDEELVRIIRGQESPVESAEMSQLICRYTRVIRIKAARINRVGAESDDLIQEGFLGLLGAVKTYREERGKFSAYADACIENRMRSAAARAGKGIAKADYDFERLSDESAQTEDFIILKEHNSELSVKLEKLLSKREYEVLRLYLAGFRYKEIADRLSLTVKSVDNSLTRSRQKLKKLL